MRSTNSPMEYLAAFALVFLAGALSMAGVGMYMQKLTKRVMEPHPENSE